MVLTKQLRRLFIWSLGFHLVASIFSEGYHHYDEQYQILEFISLKLGISTPPDLPWEFARHMRPWLQPFVGWMLAKISSWVGISSPFVWASEFRILSGTLGWISTVALVLMARPWFRTAFFYHVTVASLALLWFFPYLHVRPSSESWATSFFLLGLFALWRKDSLGWALAAGFAWGLAFHSRYSVLLMMAPAACWVGIFQRPRFRTALQTSLGFLAVLAIGIAIDRWGYGTWAFAPWQYFKSNLVDNRISSFGTTPWWMYFRYIPFDATFPFGWALILGTLLGWILFPKSLVTWACLPYVLFHVLLGHKETRFLFPVAPFSVCLLMMSLEKMRRAVPIRWMISRPVIKVVVIVNFFMLIAVSVKPASAEVALYHFIYGKDPKHFEYYSMEGDPYVAFGLRAKFYEPKQIIRHEIKSFVKISGPSREIIFVTRNFFLPPESLSTLEECRAIYRTVPSYVTAFNFGHWIERTALWSVFECRKK